MNWWEYDVQLYSQIFYSLYSIEKLMKNAMKKNNIGVFYYIQNLLISMSNIAKILYNNKNKESITRSKEYQEYLNIDIKLLPNIMNKEIRNTNEHIDERLDFAFQQFKYVSDMCTGREHIDHRGTMRFYNTKENIIEFIDRQFQIRTLHIKNIKEELEYLRQLEPINYIYERYDGYDKIY